MTTAFKRRTVYILAFFIPVMTMAVVLIICRIYPFGEHCFTISDMVTRQLPFLVEFRRKLRAGESLAYSWNLGIGDDFFLIYMYYLASPENWLFALFPASRAQGFLEFWVVVKIGLSGMTMAHFLAHRTETAIWDSRILMFAAFYALSGYTVSYYPSCICMNAIVLAPLIMMGIEGLVREGRWRLLLFSFTACIATSYSMTVPVCIFCVFFFAVQLIIHNAHEIKRALITIAEFLGVAVLGASLCAVLILPTIMALRGNHAVTSPAPEHLEQYFAPFFAFGRHCVGSATPIMNSRHQPSLYCGALVFLLLPMYLSHPRISLKKKICNTVLLAIFWVSFTCNIPEYIWHGLSVPEYNPAIEGFLYIFLVVSMCYEVASAGRTSSRGYLYGILLATLWTATVMYAGCNNYWLELAQVVVTLVFIALYVIIFIICSKRFVKTGSAIAVFLACTELLTHAVFVFSNNQSLYADDTYPAGAAHEYELLQADIDNPGRARVMRMPAYLSNEGAWGGMSALDHAASTVNSKITNLYNHLGLTGKDESYLHKRVTPLEAAILGRRYTYCEPEYNDIRGPLYETIDSSGSARIYRNTDTLPMGWVIPDTLADQMSSDILEGDITDSRSLEVTQNLAMSITGKPLFKLLPEDIQHRPADDLKRVEVTVEDTGYYYMVLTQFAIGAIGYTVNGDAVQLTDPARDALVFLGYLDEGSVMGFEHLSKYSSGDYISIEVKSESEKTAQEYISMDLYELDMDVYEQCLSALSKHPLTDVTQGARTLSGRVNIEDSGSLILPVADGTGWEVTVDGQKTPHTEWADCFIQVPLDSGAHEITMIYRTRGIIIGLAITILAMVFTVFMLMKKYKKVARPIGRINIRNMTWPRMSQVVASALASFALVFTLFIFSPLDLFVHNAVNYQIGIRTELGAILPAAVIVWILLLAILLIPLWTDNARRVVLFILCGCTLAMYAQILFMNGEMAAITGDTVDYAVPTIWHIINCVIYVMVALAPLCVYAIASHYHKETLYDKFPTIISAVLCGMQLAGLVSAGVTCKIPDGYEQDPQYLTYAPVLQAGTEQNIDVFIFDRLDGRYMDEALDNHPEIYEWLDGFTFYRDNVSEFSSTFPSVPKLLTGVDYTLGDEWNDYWQKAWSSHTFIDELVNNGYTSNLLLDKATTYGSFDELAGRADNIEACEGLTVNKNQILRTNVRLSMLRCLPYLAKSTCGTISSSFSNEFFEYDMSKDGQTPAVGSETDMNFFAYMKDHPVTIGDSAKTFNFIHLNAAHAGGYRYDGQSGSVVAGGDYAEATYACFVIVHDYIEQLKKLGVYDNTAIVIMADHGNTIKLSHREDGAYKIDEKVTATLLVKPDGARGRLEIDEVTPLSHKYFDASILEIAGIDHDGWGPSYWDIMKMEDPPSRIYNVSAFHDFGDVGHACAYEITGDANDFANWRYLP